jgi:hypothetical protein
MTGIEGVLVLAAYLIVGATVYGAVGDDWSIDRGFIATFWIAFLICQVCMWLLIPFVSLGQKIRAFAQRRGA